MLNLSTIILYTLGALVIIISPGPDFLYVTTRGISQGRLAGILSAAGISLGLVVHTILAALGLSAILSTSGIAFQTVKYLGSGYLIYLGIKALLSKENLIAARDNKQLDRLSILRQGIFTNVFNPKAVITFMAFIPQFINPADNHAAIRIAVLGGILAFLAILWFGLVGFFAGGIGMWLSKKVFWQKLVRWITGSVLLGLGMRLAFIKRES